MSAGESRHAEIAGGGIGGLSTAILLARSGWTVTVHERMPEIREIGASLALHHTSLVVFEELGLLDDMGRKATHFTRSAMLDRNGKVLMARDLGPVSRTVNPLRDAVITTLYASAAQNGVEVVTNSNVTSVSADGVLRTEQGEEREADLIVAADGVHSRLRDSLGLLKRKRVLPTGCTRTVIPRGGFDREDAFREYWSGHRRMGVCPTSEDQTYVYLACLESDLCGSALPIDAEDWQRSIPALPDEFASRLDQGKAVRHQYTNITCERWYRGRVAIIGDAAHALPPTLGQGVGLSVSNARALVDVLTRESNVEIALPHWERSFRKVTDATQRWSLLYEGLSRLWPEPIEPGRVWFMRALRRINIEERMEVANQAAEQHAVSRATSLGAP